MNRGLLLVAVAAIIAAIAAPAAAAGPDGPVAGQGPGPIRGEPQIPNAPEQRMDCVSNPTDPRCRSNACAGPTQIYGYDEATCTPCLDNSIADHTNRRCVCVAGFAQVASDQWGRATCETETAPRVTAPVLQTVSVDAVQFYQASADQGFGHDIVSLPFGSSCVVSIRPSGIRMEHFPIATSVITPAPWDVDDFSCNVRLFGSQMQNGWEFVAVDPVDASFCDGQHYGIQITKRNSPPTDTVVDVRLSAWGGSAGFCHAEVRTVTLRGPSGEDWKRAFGH